MIHTDVIKSLDRICEFQSMPTVNLLSVYQSKRVYFSEAPPVRIAYSTRKYVQSLRLSSFLSNKIMPTRSSRKICKIQLKGSIFASNRPGDSWNQHFRAVPGSVLPLITTWIPEETLSLFNTLICILIFTSCN